MRDSCIILADKHQNMLESIRGLLETLFANVVMVADQPSLFYTLDQLHPKLAIVDLSLSGYGNLDTTEKISHCFPDTEIIVLSNYDDREIVDDVMAAGASGYVLKPNAGTELFDAITNIQKGQTYISSMVKKHDCPKEISDFE